MSNATLCLHRGARHVSIEELAAVPCPQAEGRWNPVSHYAVLGHAKAAIGSAGYDIQKMDIGISQCQQRFWGTFVLGSPVAAGVSLAVAIASSTDKSISLRWAYGHRVFVCDNGAWTAERTIARKHTINGVVRYQEAICRAVGELEQYQQIESDRIGKMIRRELTNYQAESFLLRAYQDEGILSPRTLPDALGEWRNPTHAYEGERSAWHLFNAVTWALKGRQKTSPQAHAAATMRLGAMLQEELVTV